MSIFDRSNRKRIGGGNLSKSAITRLGNTSPSLPKSPCLSLGIRCDLQTNTSRTAQHPVINYIEGQQWYGLGLQPEGGWMTGVISSKRAESVNVFNALTWPKTVGLGTHYLVQNRKRFDGIFFHS